MIDAPEIVQTEARPAATVRITVSRREVGQVMDAAIQEVLRALASQHVPPAGPLFAHHARIEPEVFVFDVGFPVRAAITPVGRVENTTVPAARAARTVYTGPYEGLGAAWGEFLQWIRAQGLTPGPNAWEVYAYGPERTQDPARYRTELVRPLAG
ncbi:MAG: GyrI-like domain-containing protein [Polyangiales bacterium]